MFVSEKARGEAQQLFAKTPYKPAITKLSEAIRAGIPKVEESRTWNGCALATAAIGAGYDGYMSGSGISGFLNEKFGTPYETLAWVSSMHCHGHSRDALAAVLESRGQ